RCGHDYTAIIAFGQKFETMYYLPAPGACAIVSACFKRCIKIRCTASIFAVFAAKFTVSGVCFAGWSRVGRAHFATFLQEVCQPVLFILVLLHRSLNHGRRLKPIVLCDYTHGALDDPLKNCLTGV